MTSGTLSTIIDQKESGVTCTFIIIASDFQLGKLDKEGSHKILDKFAALGGNFIDTANMYTKGVSESIIGEWLVK